MNPKAPRSSNADFTQNSNRAGKYWSNNSQSQALKEKDASRFFSRSPACLCGHMEKPSTACCARLGGATSRVILEQPPASVGL